MLLSILAVVVVFGVIIAVHEFGHMLAAKLCGVAVPDFALGMGPSLASRVWRGTRYHLCALPIGGFVNIAGMAGDDPLNNPAQQAGSAIPESQTWSATNGWQKAFILVAGVLMNLALGLTLMFVMGLAGFPQNTVLIGSVDPGSPAAEAGLKASDRVLTLAGKQITNSRQFSAIVRAHTNQAAELRVVRGGQELTLTVRPRVIQDYNQGKISLGVGLVEMPYSTTTVGFISPKSQGQPLGFKSGDRVVAVNGKPVNNGFDVLFALPTFDDKLNAVDAQGQPIPKGGGTPVRLTVERGTEMLEITVPGDVNALTLGLQFKPLLEHLPLGESIRRSAREAYNMVVGFAFGLRMMFSAQGLQSMSGPVGIMTIIGQSAHSDWYTFLQIVVLINLSLAFFNVLPVPPLDGGRLLFVALSGIGLRVPPRREALVNAVGMVVLLCLIGLVTFTDLLAWF